MPLHACGVLSGAWAGRARRLSPVSGAAAGLFPGEWVMPAVPGFGTAGIRAAAAGWRVEGRLSFLWRARDSAPLLTGWTFLGAQRPRAGRGVRGAGLWGAPWSRLIERVAPLSLPLMLTYRACSLARVRPWPDGAAGGGLRDGGQGCASVPAPFGAVPAGPGRLRVPAWSWCSLPFLAAALGYRPGGGRRRRG